MLTTDRLILRAARQTDLMDLFAVYSNAQAMRYWSTPPHMGPEITQGAINRQIRSARQALTYFVIEKDGRAIGHYLMQH